jgi:hypothetical protein
MYNGLTLKLTDGIFHYRSHQSPKCLLSTTVRSKIRLFLRVIINNLNKLPFDLESIYNYLKRFVLDKNVLTEIVAAMVTYVDVPLPTQIAEDLDISPVKNINTYRIYQIAENLWISPFRNINISREKPVGPVILKLLPRIYMLKYIVLHGLLKEIISTCIVNQRYKGFKPLTVHTLYRRILCYPHLKHIYGKYIPLVPFDQILLRPYSKQLRPIIKSNLIIPSRDGPELKDYLLKTDSYDEELFLANVDVCIVYSRIIFDNTSHQPSGFDDQTIDDTIALMKSKFKGSVPMNIRNNRLKIIQYVMIRGILRYAHDLNGCCNLISYENLIDAVVPANPYIGEFVEQYIYTPVRNDRKC